MQENTRSENLSPVDPQDAKALNQACMEELLLYMFNHREAFHLLLLCSEGTRYSSMKEELVQLEVNATHRYYLVLEKLGTPAPQIDPRLRRTTEAQSAVQPFLSKNLNEIL